MVVSIESLTLELFICELCSDDSSSRCSLTQHFEIAFEFSLHLLLSLLSLIAACLYIISAIARLPLLLFNAYHHYCTKVPDTVKYLFFPGSPWGGYKLIPEFPVRR